MLVPFERRSASLCRAKSSIKMSGDDVEQASSSPQGGEKSQNIKTSINRLFCVAVRQCRQPEISNL